MHTKIVFLFIAVSYAVYFILIPPFQNPDEPEHYENVYWFSNGVYPKLPPMGTLPKHQSIQRIVSLYNWYEVGSNKFVIPNFKAIRSSDLQRISHATNREVNAYQPVTSLTYNPPMYYIVGAFFYRISRILNMSIIDQYYVTRLASTLFYFGSVVVAYGILKTFFRKQKTAEYLLVAFSINPLVIKMGVGVSNDMAFTLFALTFLYYSLLYAKKLKYVHIIYMATICACATLSKFTGIALVFAFVLIAYIYLRTYVEKIKKILLFLGTVFFLLSPWFILNYLRYKKLIVDNFSIIPPHALPVYPLWRVGFEAFFEFRHTAMHYAGFMGWNDAYPFKEFFIAYTVGVGVISLISLIGLIRLIMKKNIHAVVLTSFIASIFLFLLALSFKFKLERLSWDIQGRYAIPIFFAMILGFVYCVNMFYRQKEEVVGRLLFAFAIFQYYFILFFILIPKYYV